MKSYPQRIALEKPKEAGEAMGQTAEVLVIDDEVSVADALGIILRDHGYEVVTAKTGLEGLAICDGRRFDVTITDLRLPDMSGLEVLSRIKKRDPRSQVIVITAYGTPEAIADSMKLGAVDVLAKPFLPSDVLRLIDAALARR